MCIALFHTHTLTPPCLAVYLVIVDTPHATFQELEVSCLLNFIVINLSPSLHWPRPSSAMTFV